MANNSRNDHLNPPIVLPSVNLNFNWIIKKLKQFSLWMKDGASSAGE